MMMMINTNSIGWANVMCSAVKPSWPGALPFFSWAIQEISVQQLTVDSIRTSVYMIIFCKARLKFLEELCMSCIWIRHTCGTKKLKQGSLQHFYYHSDHLPQVTVYLYQIWISRCSKKLWDLCSLMRRRLDYLRTGEHSLVLRTYQSLIFQFIKAHKHIVKFLTWCEGTITFYLYCIVL